MMNCFFEYDRTSLRAAIAALVLSVALPAMAQNPFDEVDDEAAEIAEEAEPAPAAPTAVAEPAAPAADAPTLTDFARRDPAVAAVLELPRQTPAQKFRAVMTLIDLGHPEAAAMVLPELLGAGLDAKQQAELVREFGSARFLKLIRLDPPTEEGAPPNLLAGVGAFAQSALDAAAAEARDPTRIAALIAQLNAPAEGDRYAARVDLRTTGEAGIAALFAALAGAETEEVRANLLAALADMPPAVDEPLLAVLADAQGQLRRDAAELAGHIELDPALPLLAAIAVSSDGSAAAAARTALQKLGKPAPAPAEVEALLRRELDAVEQEPLPTIGDGSVGVWWSWNHQTRQLAASEYPLPALRTLAAARFSRALAEVGALGTPSVVRLAVIYGLEEAALLGREPSEALRQLIASTTPAELNITLGIAAEKSHIAAAVQLAAELARRGDATILATSDGRPSPLAAALASPVRELRFAALGAITQLAPSRSFPGSSYVADALWYFIAGAGEPTAVTASPDIVQASDWAGKLRGAGFEATPTRTGREALLAAIDPATGSRLAVVVLDSDLGEPLVGEVAYQLHANSDTASVPILIASSVPRLAAAQRIAAHDPLVLAMPRPHGEGALAALVQRTLGLAPRQLASSEQRTAEAAQALAWLAKLLHEGSPYDELQRDTSLVNRTLLISELSGPSIQVLAALGTADSQTALLAYAGAQAAPIEGRRAAASAFGASVQKFGLQLTRDEIVRQYERYNASETADADTQQVLGQILDVIERKPAQP